MNTSIDQLFNPGKKFIDQTFAISQGWKKEIYNIIYRGIVLKINVSNDVGDSAVIAPPYSIQAKIITEDVSTENPKNDANKWIPPFYSSHILSIPEVGEEVWILRETTERVSRVFWLNRVSDSNYISKTLAREYIKNTSPVDRYGFPFKVEDIAENVTQTKENVFSIPALPGDVIMQGRTDTFIRHSMNPSNLEGVLELGIKNREKYLHSNLPTIGTTRTKTLHAISTNISKFSGRSTLTDDNTDRDIIYNEADKIYNVSKLNSDVFIYRQVLGEKQNSWLVDLLSTLQNILNINISILNLLNDQHQHTVPSYKEKKILKLAIGQNVVSVDFDINIPQRNTILTNTSTNITQNVNSTISTLNNKLKVLNNKLEENLSLHNFIN